MDKKVLIALIVLGTLSLYALALEKPKELTKIPTPSVTVTPTKAMTEEEMQKHIKQMDNGNTIMAMGGKFYPNVFYAKPMQKITAINHENQPVSFVSKDNYFMIKNLASKKETQIIAPGYP